VTSTSLSVSEDEPPELVVPQPVTVAVLPAYVGLGGGMHTGNTVSLT